MAESSRVKQSKFEGKVAMMNKEKGILWGAAESAAFPGFKILRHLNLQVFDHLQSTTLVIQLESEGVNNLFFHLNTISLCDIRIAVTNYPGGLQTTVKTNRRTLGT